MHLQGLNLLTVLGYALCLRFVNGFESHSLRQFPLGQHIHCITLDFSCLGVYHGVLDNKQTP
jgi:hypothetical protein